MISQKQFQKLNQKRWNETQEQVEVLSSREELTPQAARSLPGYFRKVCQELGISQERMYSQRLTNRLNQMVMDLFHHVHRSKSSLKPVTFMARTFPGAFKYNVHFFIIGVVLFWLPCVLMAFAANNDGMAWVQSILGEAGMTQIDAMYGADGDALEYGREEYGSDFMMFCYYVMNNVSIDFRCYAGGMFFGIGTLFYTIYNGLAIGSVFGYVHAVGDPTKLWTFVAGHSAFEIIGLHLSSAAGMRLGWGIISPGNQSRLSSLARSARESLVLLGGAAILTFLAAFIEGFWSGHDQPAMLKYGVGITLWGLTLIYLFSGKKQYYERP